MNVASTGFGALNAHLRAAVEASIEAGRDPNDATAGFYISDELALRYARVADATALDGRLSDAAARLGLDPLETAVLGLCSAPELDPRYGKVFAFLHDDVTRKLPSPRLIGDVLDEAAWSRADVVACFAASGRLRRLGCVELLEDDPQRPFLDRAVKLSEPLVASLLGIPLAERGAGAGLRALDPPEHDVGRAETVAHLRSLLAEATELPIVVAGPDSPALLAAALGAPLLLADIRRLGDARVHAHATLVCRLEGRRLVFDGLDDLDSGGRARCAAALEAAERRALICARSADAVRALGEVGAMVVRVPAPTLAERRRAWAQLSPETESGQVAEKFRLSIAQIATAAEIARVEAGAQGRGRPAADDLARGARQASSTGLSELARRLEPSYRWRDLVLPERELALLRSIGAYLRHRDHVLSDWGFERVAQSQGLKVLFAGESGTGKTMAAQVLANDLGLELFHVDLATIVSKYIGETEKNLDRIFDAAEGSNAILFFDEADALFGKRSEVADAHDRYANIEVAYLLQKMDSYAGAIILATNFKRNIDTAFQRRLDFSIDFPFPESPSRRRIWEFVLPGRAPIAGDVDLEFLASRFALSGGAIRNCALAAAFEAAEAGQEIAMEQLVRAVGREYEKQGRLTLKAEFEPFHPLLAIAGADTAVQDPREPEPDSAPAAPPPERLLVRSRIDEVP